MPAEARGAGSAAAPGVVKSRNMPSTAPIHIFAPSAATDATWSSDSSTWSFQVSPAAMNWFMPSARKVVRAPPCIVPCIRMMPCSSSGGSMSSRSCSSRITCTRTWRVRSVPAFASTTSTRRPSRTMEASSARVM